MPENRVKGTKYKTARVGGKSPSRKSPAAMKKKERFQPGTRRAIKRGGKASKHKY